MSSDNEEVEDISPHIRIRIDPRKKKKWLEYADEHHHGNLTDLIKDAVDNTIDDKWVLEDKHLSGTDIDTSEIEDGISEVKDRLSVLERTINESLYSSEETEQDLTRDELIKLANRCHDLLPPLQGPIQFPSLQHAFSFEADDLPTEIKQKINSDSNEESVERVRAKVTGRAEDLADALEEPVHHVRQALMFLEQTKTGFHVESVIDEGERRWFIRDPDASPDFDFLKNSDDKSDDLVVNNK